MDEYIEDYNCPNCKNEMEEIESFIADDKLIIILQCPKCKTIGVSN